MLTDFPPLECDLKNDFSTAELHEMAIQAGKFN